MSKKSRRRRAGSSRATGMRTPGGPPVSAPSRSPTTAAGTWPIGGRRFQRPPGELPASTSPVQDAVDGLGAIQVIVGLVTTGSLDEHLGTLQAAISRRHRERYRDASNRRAAELAIGDRVRLARDVRPQYLKGATGTVVGWASTNVVVRLDETAGRFTSGELRCPPLGLERIS